MSFRQLCQKWRCKINSTNCPFWKSNNFRKYPRTKARKIQVLLYKFKDIQGLEFLFSNSRTFKDFQVLLYKFKDIRGLSSISLQIQGHSRTFKYFFTNSRIIKALNFCFQIQGHSRAFKFCTNSDFNTNSCINKFDFLLTDIMLTGRQTNTHKRGWEHNLLT
jgi:hypothetical protein